MSEIDSSISVVLRVRPLVKSEIDRGCQHVIERAVDSSPQVTVNRTDSFTYSYVFESSDSQKDLYEACVLPKIKQLLRGYNVTILAYGQTGSGKTYTMGTAYNGVFDDDVGVIPRSIQDIFDNIGSLSAEYDVTVKCSFLELYQEQLIDLLSTKERDLSTVELREDKGVVVIPGLTEVLVSSAQDVIDQLMRGSSGRAVASTAMNEQSSRSHAIFTVTIIACKKNDKKLMTTSRFNLVDLAGSERCAKTLASGDRFKEGVNINKGLLALGNVINTLGSGQNGTFVPYRQSKLTRLLQDSLGGNSITVMIACVSPADYNLSETLSTLRYADRALQIKNKPIVNVDPHAAEVNLLKDIIQKLRVELLTGGNGMSSSINSAVSSAGLAPASNAITCAEQRSHQQVTEELKKMKDEYLKLEQKNRKLQRDLHQALLDVADHDMRAHIAETSHDKLKSDMIKLKDLLKSHGNVIKTDLNDDAQDEANDKNNEQWQQHIREISQLVLTMDEEHQRTESELQEHRKTFLISGSDSHNSEFGSVACNEEINELVRSHAEKYTNKQLDLNEELRGINRELNVKQELHERVCKNFKALYALEGNIAEDKIKDCEKKIQELELERKELNEQLLKVKTKDISAKLAEERRKRLQNLEQELLDMRRRTTQQSKMLKMREKEHEKIQNLSAEIRTMKESKVKLIRAMRVESEKFRQWKQQREKEVTQLKSKDRKMQSEMVRQQTLHTKQRQVLTRKCEEAVAANKRLKEALERQKNAQRQRHAKDQGGVKTNAWLDGELEVILSLIDAEQSLEQLMEDRAVINKRINDLKRQLKLPKMKQGSQIFVSINEELASLEKELEMRNAQIADLQQKVCVNDLESRMRTISEGAQNVGELRAVSKHLLKTLVQLRREQTHSILEQKIMLDEKIKKLSNADERIDTLLKEMRSISVKHKETLADQQRAFEEKIGVLLYQPQIIAPPDDPERQRFQEIMHNMIAAQKKSKKTNRNTESFMETESPVTISESEDYIESDVEQDPDWVPKWKKKRSAANKTNENSGISNSTVFDATLDVTESSQNAKCIKCKCRLKCDSKRCVCFVDGKSCSKLCFCKTHCRNPANEKRSNDEDDDNHEVSQKDVNENSNNKLSTPPNEINNATVILSGSTERINILSEHNENRDIDSNPSILVPPATPMSTKRTSLSRLSCLDFNTPSTKKKFF